MGYMNKLLLLIIGISTFTMAQQTTDSFKQPKAAKIPVVLEKHNHKRIDDYFWMNQRDSKAVLDYLAEENAYTESYFNQTEALQSTLLKEFEARIDPNDVSAPFLLNGNKYQLKSVEGKDYQEIHRWVGEKSELFFDENERSEGKSFYELADWIPSPNNEILAVCEDFIGRRKYQITFRSNNNGTYLKDKITDTDGTLVWANDNKTVFYVKKDPKTLREYQIFKHVLGTKNTDDVLVYQENDERFSVHLEKTLTDNYILIYSFSSTTSEASLIDADNPSQQPEVILKREQGHIYSIFHHTNGFYLLTNKNAKNNQLVFSSSKPSSIASCSLVIAHDDDVLIENCLVLENKIIAETRSNGLKKINLFDLSGKTEGSIDFKEETYYTGLSLNDDFFAKELYFVYNSLTTPSSVYTYDLALKKQTLFFRRALLDTTFSPENYISERIWATANDGTKIPISIVYKKGTEISKAPLLLYAYGSYGYTTPDVFSATRLSLLDRGVVYAIAHVRGSKYMGEKWYDDGKLMKKVNTFTDYINAAEYLGMKGYCDKDRIYAQGGSAGGLLMGAVTNMAPYLWKGVIAQVPFVDVVTTMLDETIPLTVGEYEEWGNPNDLDAYFYMLNYSPYDNVKRMDYPAILITTGYHDSQVQYWEPMKWVAKLRDYRTNDQLLIFDCNMDAGHGGGSGRTNERKETAKEFAFILQLENIEN
jgi:oligopeptidase B